MYILGIETSCDETAAAVIERDSWGGGHIRANIVYSQIADHAPYGGVVPEIAARAHVDLLDGLIVRALDEAGLDLPDIDAVAATAGPGLVGGLLVGMMSAKAIAYAADKPFLGINHLEGHILTARLTHGLAFPYLTLLVSGGHTQIVLVKALGDYERLGTTIDDALGEAFDKTAKLLGLSYPGGPAVEQAALAGDAGRFTLPRPLRGTDSFHFSFSGLKTAVRQVALACIPLEERDIADICAAFQAAVADILVDRLARACDLFRNRYPQLLQPALVVAGGVAANKAIRTLLQDLCDRQGFDFIAPPLALCTDNAAMIGWAAAEHFATGKRDLFTVAPRARWPLDEKNPTIYGSGRKGAKA